MATTMSIKAPATLEPVDTQQRPGLIPHGLFGMAIFVIAEIIFFAGMISAFLIAKTSAIGAWPPPGQPRLPVESTALNTLALLASGVMLVVAHRAFRRQQASARTPLLLAIGLGGFFVLFQGVEWVSLLREGLTLTSSNHGSFFYFIVGMHALHAVAALAALIYVYIALLRRRLFPSRFYAAELFWYFVVCLWPVLYWQVYL